MKIYISFGQVHTHSVNGKTFDKDCLAEIKCESINKGREIAYAAFDDKWGTSYEFKDLEDILQHFPRGIIKL